MLERRIRKPVEKEMEEEQAAFRPGRQTQDHIYTIRTTMEKSITKNHDLYLAFLDLKAAFDSVPRQRVWEALTVKRCCKEHIRAASGISSNRW